MRLIKKKFIFAALLLGVIAVIVTVRQDLMAVPRVRVGELHVDLPAKPRMHFFALGDTGTGGPEQLKVAAAMNARCRESGGIDGILMLGDNIYPIGATSVTDSQWQTKVVGPYSADCIGQATLFPVLGNHDYKENPSAQIEYTLINPRWYMPNRFYSVSFGKLLRLVALDSNWSEICFNPMFCGVDFMRANVNNQDTAWTVVTAHHPIASSSDHGFNYRGGLRGMLLRPYLCNRVDAYLSGHSHHLEHVHQDDCRMDIFVAGGGGAEIYQPQVTDTKEVKFARAAHGFLDIEVSEDEMVARFIDADGHELHVLRKNRSTPKVPG